MSSSPELTARNTTDAVYLAALQHSGITVTNRANAITAGHAICLLLSQGHSETEIVAMVMKDNPTFSAAVARDSDSVIGAVSAYCPDEMR